MFEGETFNFQLSTLFHTVYSIDINNYFYNTFTIKKRKRKSQSGWESTCTEAKGAAAFELATVVLAVKKVKSHAVLFSI